MLRRSCRTLVQRNREVDKRPPLPTALNKPQSGFQNPTDEPYFWNDDVHKDIIDDCDHQDCVNWERKLEALANLLALAESKRARTTLHRQHDTRYIKASLRVREAHDAIDRHSQLWTTRMAEPSSADNTILRVKPRTSVLPRRGAQHIDSLPVGVMKSIEQVLEQKTSQSALSTPRKTTTQGPNHGTLTMELTIQSTL